VFQPRVNTVIAQLLLLRPERDALTQQGGLATAVAGFAGQILQRMHELVQDDRTSRYAGELVPFFYEQFILIVNVKPHGRTFATRADVASDLVPERIRYPGNNPAVCIRRIARPLLKFA